MPTTEIPIAAASNTDEERHKRDFRRARRKAREAAGEIRELNIVAMMDMMTILLVFLLKSYQASTINVNMGEHLAIPVDQHQCGLGAAAIHAKQ